MEKDNLCQNCLNEIRKTQTRDKRTSLGLSVGWQIFLCLVPFLHYILQAYSFYRIKKLRKYLIYFIIIHAPAIVLLVIGAENHDLEILLYMGIAGLVGGYFIPVIWVIDWTRQYNKNLDS